MLYIYVHLLGHSALAVVPWIQLEWSFFHHRTMMLDWLGILLDSFKTQNIMCLFLPEYRAHPKLGVPMTDRLKDFPTYFLSCILSSSRWSKHGDLNAPTVSTSGANNVLAALPFIGLMDVKDL